MWQGINNITGFKGNKPATVNIAASLPDELNTFYARFEAHNTAHTESAPTAAAEEVSPLSLSVADVTRSFKRVNIRKAVGPDGIPGRVLKACAYQLAGVFTDIFNLSLSLSVVPSCFKKSTIVPIPKKNKITCLNGLEARCSDTHLQQVFWEAHQRPHLLCAACLTGPTTICIPQKPFHRRRYCLHPAHCSLPPGK